LVRKKETEEREAREADRMDTDRELDEKTLKEHGGRSAMELSIAKQKEEIIDGVRNTQKFHSCRYDTSVPELLWEEFPEMQNCASGNMSLGNFTNPVLSLRNPSLAGVHPALRVTVLAYRHNWYIHQRGVVQKVWR